MKTGHTFFCFVFEWPAESPHFCALFSLTKWRLETRYSFPETGRKGAGEAMLLYQSYIIEPSSPFFLRSPWVTRQRNWTWYPSGAASKSMPHSHAFFLSRSRTHFGSLFCEPPRACQRNSEKNTVGEWMVRANATHMCEVMCILFVAIHVFVAVNGMPWYGFFISHLQFLHVLLVIL